MLRVAPLGFTTTLTCSNAVFLQKKMASAATAYQHKGGMNSCLVFKRINVGNIICPHKNGGKKIWDFYSQTADAPSWCIIAAMASEGVTTDTK